MNNAQAHFSFPLPVQATYCRTGPSVQKPPVTGYVWNDCINIIINLAMFIEKYILHQRQWSLITPQNTWNMIAMWYICWEQEFSKEWGKFVYDYWENCPSSFQTVNSWLVTADHNTLTKPWFKLCIKGMFRFSWFVIYCLLYLVLAWKECIQLFNMLCSDLWPSRTANRCQPDLTVIRTYLLKIVHIFWGVKFIGIFTNDHS